MQGPEAIVSSGSPITSESTSTSILPAVQARARPPALAAQAARRTSLRLPMSAPCAERNRVAAIVSSSDTPSRGARSSAEPPPEINTIARSLWSMPASRARIARVASTTRGVGRLAPAGLVARTSICSSRRVEPSGTLTKPVTSVPSQAGPLSSVSIPFAMPAAALPAPTTTILRGWGRPAGSRNCCSSVARSARSCSGCTARMAAATIALRSAPSSAGDPIMCPALAENSSDQTGSDRCHRGLPPRAI